MRSAYKYRPSSRNESSSFLKWILILGGIMVSVFLLGKIFDSGSPEEELRGIEVSGSGQITISDKDGKKRTVENTDTLSSSDSMLSVIAGWAYLQENGTEIWVDKGGEIANRNTSLSGIRLEIMNGRTWIEAKEDIVLKMKHIDVELSADDIALVEQQRVYSIVYVLRGDASILATNDRKYTLTTGNRIMVSQSNLVSPGTTLQSLAGTIDESIQQNAFFIARNGQKILAENLINTNTGEIMSGAMISSTGTSLPLSGGKYISITSPIDGSILTGTSLDVSGKILSPNVVRITINDKDARITNDTFSVKGIAVSSDTIDLVYKGYDAGSNILERGVITLYSKDKKQGTDRLVPTTFPVSDKTFQIISPTENPYKTSNSAVTVSGVVPKDMVDYITVNNFRLRKYSAYGTNWYYYANTAYGTMKEGFNLYEIKFFGPNDTLLSTQLFTIIKEGGTTLSGE